MVVRQIRQFSWYEQKEGEVKVERFPYKVAG